MKPPNITPPPNAEQPTMAAEQTQTVPPTSQIIVSKPQATNVTSQIQQAPLALTTQPQAQVEQTPQISQTSQQQSQQQQPQGTLIQIQTKPQQSTTTTSTTTTAPVPTAAPTPTTTTPTTTIPLQATTQPITLAATPTSTGSTALVIIPQHPTTSINSKGAAISTTKTTPTTVCVTTAHVTLAPATTTTAPIQLQAPMTTHVHGITHVPMNAHQQQLTTTIVPPALANRPPSTLPVVPVTTTSNTTSTIVKTEPNKYICCLLDNGVRCDRIAGNASFSARIQKIVGTKKMNFSLDPTVRHAYICDDHKGIITVAKKATNLTRETKANARNNAANNNALNTNNYSDLSARQQNLQHPVNMELMTNQNRLANNHTGTLNTMPVRQGSQIAYGHYQGAHPNQVGSMDVMMSTSFDNTGGDSMASSSGGVDVDLQQLQVNTLRRYKRHFRVQTRPGLNKMQLAESLKGHFRTLPIIEKEAITYFVYIVKCYRNKLDHNPKAD